MNGTGDRARWLGLVAALAGLWLALQLATGGIFLSPGNLYNLAVQSSVIGVLACGMVLVIASGHIDLSVGSVLGATGMVAAWLQAEPPVGLGVAWPLALAAGLAAGAAVGAWQGWWIAWRGVPAFVVTLAGLLIFRGAAFLVTDGRTVAPLDPTYQLLGGGLYGSLGPGASRGLGLAAAAVFVAARLRARRRSRAHGIAPRPATTEAFALILAIAAIAGFVEVMNAAARPGSDAGRGVPAPVLVALGVAAATAFLAHATPFGRHLFALGGSAVAAARAGIRVRRVVLGVFMWMGLLAAVGGIITTARLGAGTNSMGTLAELSAIAAAVIGGTSLRGGSGHVAGALLGAVLMQSLENGLVLLGVQSAVRQVVIGLVLIVAVWVDLRLRRATELAAA